MMTMWRCLNPKCADSDKKPGHEFTFEGDPKTVACPKCGITPAHPASIARYLHQLTPIHYEPASEIVDAEGCGEVCCQPGVTTPVGMRTLSVDAVTCPACLQSARYLAAKGKVADLKVVPEGDRKLTINPAKGTTAAEPCNC